MAFITIAIPTMRRWSFLKESIPFYLSRPEVGEIVICDETGEDIEEIRKSSFGKDSKLQLFTNETRLGIYHNKRKSLGLSTMPWVAVLDSDNQFPESWFETISFYIESKKMATKLSMFGSPSFYSINIKTGYTYQPCKNLSDLTLSKTNWNSIFTKPGWNHLLNDGNWVVPKEAYKALPEKIPEAYKKGAEFCDALFSLFCFIKNGYTIYYPEDLTYNHIVHDESSWLTRD